jgi:isoquinoline 1-oxidoreductase subunit beta
MLTALIARPPVFGGKVKSFSAERTKMVKGVRDVVQIDSGVAVVAEGFWPAKAGRDALEIVWDEGPYANISSAEMRKEYARLSEKPGAVTRREGNAGRLEPQGRESNMLRQKKAAGTAGWQPDRSHKFPLS